METFVALMKKGKVGFFENSKKLEKERFQRGNTSKSAKVYELEKSLYGDRMRKRQYKIGGELGSKE